jgi:hypothetical protein
MGRRRCSIRNLPNRAVHASGDYLWIRILALDVRNGTRVTGKGHDVGLRPHIPYLRGVSSRGQTERQRYNFCSTYPRSGIPSSRD